MTDKPLSVYLNDHLAGATFGADLAHQLEAQNEEETELARLATDIEADVDTLVDLMERLGVTRNPGKRAAAWVAEKASRVKLTGASAGSDELGTLLSLETLSLGVTGKAALWTTLLEIRDQHSELQHTDLDDLLQRAQHQRQILEAKRIEAARRALR